MAVWGEEKDVSKFLDRLAGREECADPLSDPDVLAALEAFGLEVEAD